MHEAILPPHTGRPIAQHNRRVSTIRGMRSAQLVQPTIYPASPYGGASQPNANWFIPVTAAAYGTQAAQPWIISLDRLLRKGFAVDVPWVTEAATTGEMRLSMYTSYTDPVSLASGTFGTVSFRWNHPYEPWTGDFVWVTIEAKRTSGSGNVLIGFPHGGGRQVDPNGCTGTGT